MKDEQPFLQVRCRLIFPLRVTVAKTMFLVHSVCAATKRALEVNRSTLLGRPNLSSNVVVTSG